jgi:lambda repressor-like predicted transcriptional regulator
MSGAERDKLIVSLRRRGWTYAQIGARVGMSPKSVGHALRRIAEGRPGKPPRT